MTGIACQWRPGTRIPIDAQAVGDAIETLRVRSGGQVTPARVVAAARSRRSVLHDAYEWDDTAAAASYREHHAHQLIGALVLIEVVARRDGDEQGRAAGHAPAARTAPGTSGRSMASSPTHLTHVSSQTSRR